MIKLKYIFTSALLVAAASASQAVSSQQMQKQIDKDAPAYTIQGKDSICQIFIGIFFHVPLSVPNLIGM